VDLIQAESINDMIASDSGVHNSMSLENIGGKLSEKILIIKGFIVNLLLVIEHELDFDESEILHITDAEIRTKTKEIIKEIESVAKCYYFSKTIRSGLRILLLGRPNVGKSSIYNYLLGINRSIVADIPGTTRDTIESSLEIGGHKVLLIDSAGSWESTDAIESMGIEKTKNEINLANIIILIGENLSDINAFKNTVKSKSVLKLMSKSDIHRHKNSLLSVSTENGSGFSELSTEILTKIKEYYSKNKVGGDFLINERQYEILVGCDNKMQSLLVDLNLGINRDVLADLLHVVLDEYNNIISPVDRGDIINNIFAGFCIGK
jgi:tRNA modification GTPase